MIIMNASMGKEERHMIYHYPSMQGLWWLLSWLSTEQQHRAVLRAAGTSPAIFFVGKERRRSKTTTTPLRLPASIYHILWRVFLSAHSNMIFIIAQGPGSLL
jgi:hypothetical protein